MAPTQQQAKAARAKQLAGGKTPKARVQRYLKSTEPQLKEVVKNVLLLKGMKCSNSMNIILKELRAMAAPNCKLLSKKNQIAAFDATAQQSLEFLSTKNDCALFALASHNKKRPNNLVLGRTFDHTLLDMAELGVTYFKSMMNDYGGSIPKKRVGSKPLLLFVGDAWNGSSAARNLQNLLTDFYRGTVVDKVIATGLDHIIVFTAVDQQQNATASDSQLTVHQRTYFVKLKKSPTGSKIPAPYLIPCGPDLDLELRRTQWATSDLYKAARKQPAGLKKRVKKNKSTNLFGETIGRLHLDKQNVDKLQGRKNKALRRAEKQAAEEERQAIEQELGQEKEEMGREFQQTFGFEEENGHDGKKQKRRT